MKSHAASNKNQGLAKKMGRRQVASSRYERITVSLPPETAKKVSAMAAKNRRNVSNMVYFLIIDGMTRLQREAAACAI